jgi:hypothetical protein
LEQLHISGGKLSGTIPSELGLLTDLNELHLHSGTKASTFYLGLGKRWV